MVDCGPMVSVVVILIPIREGRRVGVPVPMPHIYFAIRQNRRKTRSFSGARPVPGRSRFGSHRYGILVVRRQSFPPAARRDGARSVLVPALRRCVINGKTHPATNFCTSRITSTKRSTSALVL